jgi:glutathione S-transferase
MSDMILHHYPTSPFSEKVRVAFGIKGLAWKSVMIPRCRNGPGPSLWRRMVAVPRMMTKRGSG